MWSMEGAKTILTDNKLDKTICCDKKVKNNRIITETLMYNMRLVGNEINAFKMKWTR